MINHYAIQKALRTKLLTLEVCTTGSITVAATATGYTRSSGSFLTDGFAAGMEITGTGFSNAENNATKTITNVTALTMTCSGCVAESAASRTIAVNLPSIRAWENIEQADADGAETDHSTGEPWVHEVYLPGPMQQITLGSYAQLEADPSYVIRIYVPAGYGVGAARSYADGLLTLFAPGTALTVSGAACTVRGSPAPYSGQLLQAEAGFAVVPVTVPLRIRTANSR